MKRDLSVITNEIKKCIQEWINLENCSFPSKTEKCPFPYKIKCSAVCPAVFPKLKLRAKELNRATVCPCSAFRKSYIIKVAKEIIS